MTNHIESYGRDWIGAVRSNRKILIRGRYVQIKDFAETLDRNDFREIEMGDKKYWVFTKCVRMSRLGKVRVVIAYEDDFEEAIYLATNVLYWEGKKILKLYSRRWSIETFYRDAKQHLGLGDCQLRSYKGMEVLVPSFLGVFSPKVGCGA